MMNHIHHMLKVALLVASVFSAAAPAGASTTTTAEEYQKAFCDYMRLATVNMEAGNMDNVKQALRNASEIEKVYLASGGAAALDADECPSVNLAATYEPETSPEIDAEIRVAQRRVAEAKRRNAEQQRQEARERERAREREEEREREEKNWALLTDIVNIGVQGYTAYKQRDQQRSAIKQGAYRIRTEQERQAEKAEQERRAQQGWVERKVEDVLTTRRKKFQLSARTGWTAWGTYDVADAICSNILYRDDSMRKSSGVTIRKIEEKNDHLKSFHCGRTIVTSCTPRKKKHGHRTLYMTASSGHTTCTWKE